MRVRVRLAAVAYRSDDRAGDGLRPVSRERDRGGVVGAGVSVVAAASSPGAAGAVAVGLGARLDDVGVEGDAVDDGGDEAGVSDDAAPFAEGKVAGQPDGGLLLPLGEHLEQQLGAAGVELDVADFVDQQQVETAVAGYEAGEAAFVGGFDELVDELGAGGVADSAGLFAGGDAK